MYQFELKFLKNERDLLKWIQREQGGGRQSRSALETRVVWKEARWKVPPC